MLAQADHHNHYEHGADHHDGVPPLLVEGCQQDRGKEHREQPRVRASRRVDQQGRPEHKSQRRQQRHPGWRPVPGRCHRCHHQHQQRASDQERPPTGRPRGQHDAALDQNRDQGEGHGQGPGRVRPLSPPRGKGRKGGRTKERAHIHGVTSILVPVGDFPSTEVRQPRFDNEQDRAGWGRAAFGYG